MTSSSTLPAKTVRQSPSGLREAAASGTPLGVTQSNAPSPRVVGTVPIAGAWERSSPTNAVAPDAQTGARCREQVGRKDRGDLPEGRSGKALVRYTSPERGNAVPEWRWGEIEVTPTHLSLLSFLRASSVSAHPSAHTACCLAPTPNVGAAKWSAPSVSSVRAEERDDGRTGAETTTHGPGPRSPTPATRG